MLKTLLVASLLCFCKSETPRSAPLYATPRQFNRSPQLFFVGVSPSGRALELPSLAAAQPQSRQSLFRRHVAGGLQMNLFDRFVKVGKANLNELLNKVEDPEKMLNQIVTDMQSDLIKVRQAYAEVVATQKRKQKQMAEAERLSDEWYKRAQLALNKGEEELAREALKRKKDQSDLAASLQEQVDAQAENIQSLFNSMTQLESKIGEAKAKKEQYIARARTAKTTQKVNDMLSGVGGSSSMDAFERMKEKVETLESSAEVSKELAGVDDSLDSKFAALDAGNDVEDELSKMKNMLAGGEDKKALSAVDDELEKMRKEMGEK